MYKFFINEFFYLFIYFICFYIKYSLLILFIANKTLLFRSQYFNIRNL